MEYKKRNKLLLIVIIMLIVFIALIGVGIAYFKTDIFRGNKELFFKYSSQIANKENSFIDPQLLSYFEKQKNTAYTNEGNISANITSSDSEVQKQFDNVNNMNITFSGQVDTTNTKAEQDISIDYSNAVKFPLKYRKVGETQGLQTDYVGSKFITTNSIKNVIPENVEEPQDLFFSEEELQHITSTYVGILNEELKESYFSKIQDGKLTGYKLTLTTENLKNVIIALLETLRSDQVVLSKLNEYMQMISNSQSITSSDIDTIIESLQQNRK